MRITARRVAGGITIICGGILLLAAFWRSNYSAKGNRELATTASAVAARGGSPTFKAAPRLDYAKALKDALNESDPRHRSLDFGRLLSSWMAEDPAKAMAFLQSMPRGPEFDEGLYIVLPNLAKTDPERAVDLAHSLVTEREQQPVYSALFDQIARQNLPTAVKLLPAAAEGEGRSNALRAVAVIWADRDVLAALDWARGIENSDERKVATEATLFVRARRDPERTVSLALELLSGDSRDRVLTHAMRRLTAQNARSAATVLEHLPEGEVKTRATLDVVRALAAEQPQTALDWIKAMPSGDLRNVALSSVFDFWSASDPMAAAKYVEQMPDDSAQDTAAARLALRWAANDPGLAQQWVNNLTGNTRTTAEINLASGWAQTDPAAATRWATDLPANDPARSQAMKAAMSYWMLRDSAVAGSFANTLSEKDRAALSDR